MSRVLSELDQIARQVIEKNPGVKFSQFVQLVGANVKLQQQQSGQTN